MPRGCSIEGCERQHKGNGYCHFHWERVRWWGNPHKNNSKEKNVHHGLSHKPTWDTWKAMKSRCGKMRGYEHITYCQRWEKFLLFLEDMGEKPKGKSLDRIDNLGDYSKDNCRWATPTEQQRNKRTNRHITAHGKTLLLCEWSERTGYSVSGLRHRLDKQKLHPDIAIPKEAANEL